MGMVNVSRVPEKGKTPTSQSMNASFNGGAYLTERLTGFSIIMGITETSATLAGTLKLQGSNNAFTDNYQNEERADAIWVDIESSPIAISGSSQVGWNAEWAYYEGVRVVWTRTSGEGTALIYFLAKE